MGLVGLNLTHTDEILTGPKAVSVADTIYQQSTNSSTRTLNLTLGVTLS